MKFRSQPLREFSHFLSARSLITRGGLLLLAILIVQLFRLSVVQNASYVARAEGNLSLTRRLSPPRGNIFDRNGVPVATNRRSWSLTFSRWGLTDGETEANLARVRSLLDTPDPDQVREIVATRPRWTRHRIARRLDQDTVLPFLEQPERFPGIRVEPDFLREYPSGPDFAHLLGYVGAIQPGELERYSRPRWLADDEVGRTGLERSLDDLLTGYPGKELRRRDARGRRLAEPEILEAAVPGHDIQLTIDASLQARAMELLRGVRGSIVMMDVANGELLVLASRPTYDPSNPGAKVVDGEEVSWMNRAVRGQYPPGSTFKIVMAAAGLESGISPDRTFYCAGPYQPEGWPRAFWCSHRSGHGRTDLVDSLKWSCNCYYYELGGILEPRVINEMARRFGYGEETGGDVPGEKPGDVPDFGQVSAGERTNLVIGQGRMLATPLQVTRSFAALANGRVLPIPRIVRLIDGEEPPRPEPPPFRLSPSHRRSILEGMWRVANESGGTANKAGFPISWDLAGKTGTAENYQGGVDAWFAGVFPRSAPRYAIVAHVEQADGHGGDVAGPLVREIIARFKGEILETTEEIAMGTDHSPADSTIPR